MFKKSLFWGLAVSLVIGLAGSLGGCKPTNPVIVPEQSTPHDSDAQAPLPTTAPVEPPPGCKDLRERGGSC